MFQKFESFLFSQMSIYFEKFFSKYQCGYRQGLNMSRYLISMIEKWKKSADNCKTFAALLTDLSEAFHGLPLDLIIA